MRQTAYGSWSLQLATCLRWPNTKKGTLRSKTRLASYSECVLTASRSRLCWITVEALVVRHLYLRRSCTTLVKYTFMISEKVSFCRPNRGLGGQESRTLRFMMIK